MTKKAWLGLLIEVTVLFTWLGSATWLVYALASFANVADCLSISVAIFLWVLFAILVAMPMLIVSSMLYGFYHFTTSLFVLIQERRILQTIKNIISANIKGFKSDMERYSDLFGIGQNDK